MCHMHVVWNQTWLLSTTHLRSLVFSGVYVSLILNAVGYAQNEKPQSHRLWFFFAIAVRVS